MAGNKTIKINFFVNSMPLWGKKFAPQKFYVKKHITTFKKANLMNVNGKHYRTIWMDSNNSKVYMIDQNALPFQFHIHECSTYKDTCVAIKTMITRGAGAIGAAAGFAMAQACTEAKQSQDYQSYILEAKQAIDATRPTARNLFYATTLVYQKGLESAKAAITEAQRLADENVEAAQKIGEFGSGLIQNNAQILTHCNAGWLGFVDYGSALSPLYMAQEKGKDFFVYADETRPRNQGARLTAWELKNADIPHAIVPDNAGAYLMSQGKVDMVIVGADRIAANGDTANKIGTFEKAIIAKEFGIPFYVAVPFSTIDFSIETGNAIVIEQRDENEVLYYEGPDHKGNLHTIRMAAPGSHAINPAFDVTPQKYITAFITEKGIIKPEDLKSYVAK